MLRSTLVPSSRFHVGFYDPTRRLRLLLTNPLARTFCESPTSAQTFDSYASAQEAIDRLGGEVKKLGKVQTLRVFASV